MAGDPRDAPAWVENEAATFDGDGPLDFASASDEATATAQVAGLDEDLADPPLDDLAALDLDDHAAAAWLVDRLLSYDERIERIEAQSRAMVSALTRAAERFRAAAQPELERYFAAHPPSKARSLKLASGTIGWRKVPGGLRTTSKAAAVKWAQKQAPHLVELKVVHDVRADALREHFAATGEIPGGCEVTEDEERFYIRGPKERP